MNNDLTDITLIVDRSGSMISEWTDTIGGIKQFVKDQQAQPGRANLSIVVFDNKHEWVYDTVDIRSINVDSPDFVIPGPRGGTALLNTIGFVFNTKGETFAKMKESDRPSKVIVAVLTDGEENASREFTENQIRGMIKHQTDVYSWQIAFLSSDIQATEQAQHFGFSAGNVRHAKGTRDAMLMYSESISHSRGMDLESYRANVNSLLVPPPADSTAINTTNTPA